jgi:hypothetical protein
VTQETAEKSPADIIIDALRLTRERVVADTLTAKQQSRGALDDAIRHMLVYKDTGQRGPDPSELVELLGDPGDSEIRHALEEYAAAIGE